ncbi:hypothetical protein PSU4_00430 [Pseudonocardia sulfidoxydans NBRC 16205]|uniref:Potassium channel domain-containing protein n=1 Tax=Pseudonocardia sulfidoxydans NBRC 16205 TaxID=1223511 RepID=A0A511D8G8_9PSEU|nr:potassium channel family protein [Pseudonocardia sulfidoxydans]GEL21089.1 hypothetical protein PSU4_00430 [Pseudonocardia sulfidoxydans NBRC 16205]
MRRASQRRVSYAVVTVLVLATYAVTLAADGLIGSACAAVLQVAVVWVVLRWARAERRVLVPATAILAITTVTAVIAAVAAPTPGPAAAGLVVALFSLNMALYLVAPIVIVHDVAISGRGDGGTVLAAVAAYLQIGLFFAFLYRLIDVVSADPAFSAPVRMSDLLFFSFVTMSTTGYGDLVPIGWATETATVLEIVVGQFYLIAAVGKIVTAWIPRPGTGPSAPP